MAWSLGACLLASCLPAPTQIVVIIDAEPGVRTDGRYDHVRVRVRGHDRLGGEAVERPLLRDLEVFPETPPEHTPWPFRLVLTPERGDASRTYEVRVSADDAEREPFVEARAISGYAPGQTRALYMLLTADCVDAAACGLEQTCSRAMCVPAQIAPEHLPRLSEFDRDAGDDASRFDARPDDASDGGAPLDGWFDAPLPSRDAFELPDAPSSPDAAIDSDASTSPDASAPSDAWEPPDAFDPPDAGECLAEGALCDGTVAEDGCLARRCRSGMCVQMGCVGGLNCCTDGLCMMTVCP